MLHTILKTSFILVAVAIIFTGCGSNKFDMIEIPNSKINSINSTDKKNLIPYNNIYIGNFVKKDLEVPPDSTYDIAGNRTMFISATSINSIIRNRLKTNLQHFNQQVFLVDNKPSNFDNSNDLFIDGNIRQFSMGYNNPKNKFYYLSMEINVNDKNIYTEDKAILTYKTLSYERKENLGNDIMKVIAPFVGINIIGSNLDKIESTSTELAINNHKIASINYTRDFDYLGNHMTNARQMIRIQEFDKSGYVIQNLDGNSSGNISLYVFYNFRGPLINPLPIIYNGRTYKNKSQLAVEQALNQKEQEEFNKGSCVKDDGINHTSNRRLCEFFEIKNTEFYDYFMLYTTTNGILQNLIDSSIDKAILEIFPSTH